MTLTHEELVEKWTVEIPYDHNRRVCLGCKTLSGSSACIFDSGHSVTRAFKGVYPNGEIHMQKPLPIEECPAIKALERNNTEPVKL